VCARLYNRQVVGLPLALLLLREGCTVTICHVDTVDVKVTQNREVFKKT